MMMSCKFSNRYKIVFDQLILSFNAVNAIYMRKIGIQYKYACRAVTRVCAYWSMCANKNEYGIYDA